MKDNFKMELIPDPSRKNQEVSQAEKGKDVYISQEMLRDLRMIRDWPDDDMPGINIEDRYVAFDSGPLEVTVGGKRVHMDTSKDHFGDILDEIQVPDSERMT